MPRLDALAAHQLSQLHAGFLALLPRIFTHARITFRYLRCVHARAEAIAETVAVAWQWYLSARQRGKDPAQCPAVFASLAVRHVRSGRCLWGQEPGKDVLSCLAQRRHGFSVRPWPERGSPEPVLLEALCDNTITPPPEQAAFRLDFPRWRRRQCHRDRQIVTALLRGERIVDEARRFGLSAARISQLRRELHQDWLRFHGENVAQPS
jgi:hypothetical protein